MTKWILATCLLLAGLLAACAGSSGSASPEIGPANLGEAQSENIPTKTGTLTPEPDFSDLFAEDNQLYGRLEANIPIEVAPANASAQTAVLTMPTLF